MGRAGTDRVLDEIEGGDEIKESTEILRTFMRPVSSSVSKAMGGIKKAAKKQYKNRRYRTSTVNPVKTASGSNFVPFQTKQTEMLKKKATEAAKKRVGRRIQKTVKTTAKNTAKNTAKGTVKKVTKTTVKETVKITTKAAVKVGTAVAGACTGPQGFLIGTAAGELVGFKIDQMFMKAESKMRIIKFMKAKGGDPDKDSDNLLKLLKDLLMLRIKLVAKYALKYLLLAIGLVLIAIIIVFIPLVFIIALICSPFAIFFPDSEASETVQSVTYGYYQSFDAAVNQSLNSYIGYDSSEKIYVNMKNGTAVTENGQDVLAVYMVRYGIGDMAAVMNDYTKSNLKAVFNDMVSFTESSYSYDVTYPRTITDKKGKKKTEYYTITYHVKSVNIMLKTYEDMIAEYGLSKEQEWILRELMAEGM